MNSTIEHCENCLALVYYETNGKDWKLEKEFLNENQELYREFSHPELENKVILEDLQGLMHVFKSVVLYQNRLKKKSNSVHL